MEKRLTIRLPIKLWKQLRNLQTEGVIKSIQSAVIRTLQELVKNKPKKGSTP